MKMVSEQYFELLEGKFEVPHYPNNVQGWFNTLQQECISHISFYWYIVYIFLQSQYLYTWFVFQF
jgi:hypothetical protein